MDYYDSFRFIWSTTERDSDAVNLWSHIFSTGTIFHEIFPYFFETVNLVTERCRTSHIAHFNDQNSTSETSILSPGQEILHVLWNLYFVTDFIRARTRTLFWDKLVPIMPFNFIWIRSVFTLSPKLPNSSETPLSGFSDQIQVCSLTDILSDSLSMPPSFYPNTYYFKLTTTHQDPLYNFQHHHPFLFHNLSAASLRRLRYDELIIREAFGLERLRSAAMCNCSMLLKKLRES